MTGKIPKVSVIVCTHNRAKILSGCLQSLVGLNYPQRFLEIIIIDNASTDSTKNLVKKFTVKNHNVRYYYQSILGLSQSRNKGIQLAKGEILAFIDDDARAESNWLKELVAGYGSEAIWAVGGLVKPLFLQSPPPWMPSKYFYVLSVCNLGSRLKPVPDIIGTNMSFRKTVFSKIGYFNSKLGRIGNSLLSGEEIDLCQRIIKYNKKIIYNPKAVVCHLVPKSRLTKKYYTQRLFAEGMSLARLKNKRINLSRLGQIIYSVIKFVFYPKFSNWFDLVLNAGYVYGLFL